jgi:hypothetical protein
MYAIKFYMEQTGIYSIKKKKVKVQDCFCACFIYWDLVVRLATILIYYASKSCLIMHEMCQEF